MHRVKVGFTVAGISYATLASNAEAMANFVSKTAGRVCGSVGLPMGACSVEISAGSVQVDVSIEQSSESEATALTTDFASNSATVLEEVVTDLSSDAAIAAVADAPLSTAGYEVSSEVVTTDTTETSATGDPHVKSVSGKRFDVNQPGNYTMIRLPEDSHLPAKLELNVTLTPPEGSPCGLYIMGVVLGGEWLEGQAVSVRPLQRNQLGGNGAGDRTVFPFAVRVESGGGSGAVRERRRTAEAEALRGKYTEWRELDKNGALLSPRVRLLPLWREAYAGAGATARAEAQAFQFVISGEQGDSMKVEVSQASHQALDVKATGLRNLGYQRIGGLLGTEGHDPQIEKFSVECLQYRTRPQWRIPGPGGGSTMIAYWSGHP